MDAPPRRGVEVHSSGHLHSIGQFDRHGVVSVVGGVPNDDPLWGCHRNRCEIRVCAEFARHRNGDAISSTVTLLKGQCNGELHRLIGGNFGRTVRSYEILLNLLRGDIAGIAGGGLVVRGCRRGDTTARRRLLSVSSAARLSLASDIRRRLSVVVGSDRYRSSGVARLSLVGDRYRSSTDRLGC